MGLPESSIITIITKDITIVKSHLNSDGSGSIPNDGNLSDLRCECWREPSGEFTTPLLQCYQAGCHKQLHLQCFQQSRAWLEWLNNGNPKPPTPLQYLMSDVVPTRRQPYELPEKRNRRGTCSCSHGTQNHSPIKNPTVSAIRMQLKSTPIWNLVQLGAQLDQNWDLWSTSKKAKKWTCFAQKRLGFCK